MYCETECVRFFGYVSYVLYYPQGLLLIALLLFYGTPPQARTTICSQCASPFIIVAGAARRNSAVCSRGRAGGYPADSCGGIFTVWLVVSCWVSCESSCEQSLFRPDAIRGRIDIDIAQILHNRTRCGRGISIPRNVFSFFVRSHMTYTYQTPRVFLPIYSVTRHATVPEFS